jgi:methionyl-tRNA synthetase
MSQQTNPNPNPNLNAEAAKEQAEAAKTKIASKVENKQKDEQYTENIKTLRRLVSQASPIIENKEETKVIKDENGKEIDQTVNTKVTTGYNYYAVDGKPIEDWISATFGGNVTLNKATNELTIKKEGENVTEKTSGQEQPQAKQVKKA